MKISIVGLAKSGTSALYTAVKNQLPPDARCVFEPNSPAELKYITNNDEGGLTKIMFTSLSSCKYDSSAFDKNLFIVRDPRDIIVSSTLYRFNRLSLINKEKQFNAMLKLFKRKEENPSSLSLVKILNSFERGAAKEFRHNMAENYLRFLTFIEKTPNHCMIKYEDFIENNTDEASEYLGLKIEKPERLDGWINKINRKGTSGDWKHWLLEEDTEFFADKLNVVLEKMNYDMGWDLADQQVIDREHCSEYILRLAKSRKMDPNIKKPSEMSLEFLESAARDGKPVSLHRLGRKYLSGNDCDQDLDKAQNCLERAVELKHQDSYYWLGECYRLRKRYRKATELFELAGNKGEASAFYKLGLMYERNPKLKDHKASLDYYQKGVDLGNERCVNKLQALQPLEVT